MLCPISVEVFALILHNYLTIIQQLSGQPLIHSLTITQQVFQQVLTSIQPLIIKRHSGINPIPPMVKDRD